MLAHLAASLSRRRDGSGKARSRERAFCISGRRLGQLQVWPQTDLTSPTQMLSHLELQQYESALQIFATHGSQLDGSFVPVEHES